MYIISIKRVMDIFGTVMDKPEWEYACYDNFSGSMSTGYPIFSSLNRGIQFHTKEEAKEWIEKALPYIDMSRYDRSSLAIRKIVFKTVQKI